MQVTTDRHFGSQVTADRYLGNCDGFIFRRENGAPTLVGIRLPLVILVTIMVLGLAERYGAPTLVSFLCSAYA
jgi:hypothetical protein